MHADAAEGPHRRDLVLHLAEADARRMRQGGDLLALKKYISFI